MGGDSMNRGALLPILIIGAMLMNALPLAMGGPIQDGHPWSEAAPGEPVPLPGSGPPEDSQTTPWALLVMVLVLTFVAVALVVMRGRGGIPGQAIS